MSSEVAELDCPVTGVPDGWATRQLGEVARIVTGKTPSTKDDRFWNGDVPFVTPSDIGDSPWCDTVDRHLSPLGASTVATAPAGAVLFTCIASIGKSCILSATSAFNQQINACIPGPSVDSYFLFSQLQAMCDEIRHLAGTTAVPIINKTTFSAISICLPPLDEQRRIAEVLRSVDDAIAAKSAAIMQSKRVLSTVREALLQPHGPGSDQVPDRWQNTQLGEVCRLWNGRAYKKEELLEVGKYLVLRVGNFFTNDRWYYSDLELEDEKYCDAGDLLYAWSASFGPRVWAGGKVIYHYHIWKITVDDRLIDKDFLFHFLDWDAEQIKSSLGSGSTMIHVTKGAMEQRAISLPPLDEQRHIANTLAAIHKGINLAKADLERASQMKVALMADLLSGRVRVSA